MIFRPSNVIVPDDWSYQRSKSATMVLFPEPLAPTRAVVFPAGIERESLLRT
jgi:hypothetical protein